MPNGLDFSAEDCVECTVSADVDETTYQMYAGRRMDMKRTIARSMITKMVNSISHNGMFDMDLEGKIDPGSWRRTFTMTLRFLSKRGYKKFSDRLKIERVKGALQALDAIRKEFPAHNMLDHFEKQVLDAIEKEFKQ